MYMSVSTLTHGPGIQRIHTAPVVSLNRSTSMDPPAPGQARNPRSSKLSGTTVMSAASTSSLTSLSSVATLVPPANGGPVVQTNNIINQRADASRSLYQICVNLRRRLAQVPGFEFHLNDSDDEEEDEDSDPVHSLWRCLRKGFPLITIYNSLEPAKPLQMDSATVTPKNLAKNAAYKFLQACLEDLKLPSQECFVLSDLFGDDTTGFVKVTQVINVVLDVAEQRGLLVTPESETSAPPPSVAGTQMSYRDHVVRELVDTERKYVQDLENLHELKKTIEQKGVVPGDVVHDIFLNINAILDFQRRFLIKIETTNSQPESKQEWGLPFVSYEESFGIYQPFIANQRKAADIAKREFAKIALADHPVVVDFNTLDGFLLKPMQRLVKYPLLLKELRDKTGADEDTKADLTAGMDASNRVLQLANAAVDRELRDEALAELCVRVDDWKNHDVDHFGDLLLHGQFTVVTGKSDVEKEYTIYLFERILLCCKEINPNKATKDKLMGNTKSNKEKKEKEKRAWKDKNSKTSKLQLKGRIFMTNVTDVVSLVKPGSYTVQIWWKGDPGIENFIIRFSNEEIMKKWSSAVDNQRKECNDQKDLSANSADTPGFAWLQSQTAMANPYTQQEEEEDDEYNGGNGGYPGQSTFGTSRNASSSSLRSRSTTGESTQSIAGMVRVPPPRFPMVSQPPLSLQTQLQGQAPSPATRGGDSYFSPVADSPASSRTSQNSTFPFPRQGTPQSGWEDQSRYTAPAMARGTSRESQPPPGSYQMNGRGQQRPSPQQRSRSFSTPDINNSTGARRLPNGAQVPAVPGIPPHLHAAYDPSISRSNNTSPANGIPVRSNTQSPGIQRDRTTPQSQFNPPQYLRSNTTQIPMSALDGRTMSPPLQNSVRNELPLPTQLKVKVNCDGNYVTLVVAFNITYQSLIDRIDAKVGRFSNNAIARGTMRLRYQDEDGDFVMIESDDDIHIAFQEWREAHNSQFHSGQLGEIELFCASVEN